MSKLATPSKGIDWWFGLGLSWLMGVAALLLILIIVFLTYEAWPVIQGGLWTQFLNSDGWYPLEKKLGLLPMLWATLAVSIGALILAFPFGLGSAIFIEYYAPRFIGKPFSSVVTLLAGIPSVVFGLWGLTELVPLINNVHPPRGEFIDCNSCINSNDITNDNINQSVSIVLSPDPFVAKFCCLSAV